MKICCLLLIFVATLHAQGEAQTWSQKKSIPRWARREFTNHNLERNYTITYQLYPPYFRGDFNGDDRRDAAILVSHKKSGKFGIVIFHEKYPQTMSTQYFILGAGKPFGAGDDIKKITSWSLIPENKVNLILGNKRLPTFRGPIFKVEGKDGIKGLIFWNGKKYEWHNLNK